MLKLFGILLVSSAITLYGLCRAKDLERQKKNRHALAALMLHLQNGISHGGLPQETLYASFHNEQLEKEGFCAILRNGEPGALTQALEQTKLGLSDNMRTHYLELAEGLGKSGFRAVESERLARFLGEIAVENEKSDKEDAARQMLYKRLGLLGALLAALLLL